MWFMQKIAILIAMLVQFIIIVIIYRDFHDFYLQVYSKNAKNVILIKRKWQFYAILTAIW